MFCLQTLLEEKPYVYRNLFLPGSCSSHSWKNYEPFKEISLRAIARKKQRQEKLTCGKC